jgi:nucleotide-binding universal stress UspA family protein
MNGTIAVGIGGTGGWQALSWATAQAERTGARLALVHVCVPHSLSCEPSLRLVDASTAVRLLVIGDGAGGHTVRRVLRHAYCPVVVARPVTPAVRAPFAGHVIVGVDGSAAARAALELAFAYADAHRLPVAAVHVYESGDALLGSEVAPWSEKFPDVPVRRAVLTGPVTEQLIDSAHGARLLVLGDKRRGVISRARTGDVPMTVATEAPSPVALVPLEQMEGELW